MWVVFEFQENIKQMEAAVCLGGLLAPSKKPASGQSLLP